MTASMPRSGTARVGDVALVRAVGGHEDRHRSGRGLRVFKCGVVWPLEAASVREFATGLEEILVVEEKRQILEYALKEELYNWRDDVRPKIYGKFDEKDGRGGEWAMPQGRWLLPAHAELSPALIAKAIAARLLEPGRYGSRFELAPDVRAGIESRLAILAAKERSLAAPHVVVERTPTFCSGCPHNTSTHVPEGSRALAGIGCHYMTTWMPERRTGTFTPASRARRAGAQRQAARAGGAASGAARVRAGGPASKARRVRGEVLAPPAGAAELGPATEAGVRPRPGALPELRWRAEDHCGHPGAAGDREDPHAPGSAGPCTAACPGAWASAASGLTRPNPSACKRPSARGRETGCAQGFQHRGKAA